VVNFLLGEVSVFVIVVGVGQLAVFRLLVSLALFAEAVVALLLRQDPRRFHSDLQMKYNAS
jgi:hypothetical protein